MPNLPLRDRILENIKTTIENVVQGATYHTTVGYVAREAPTVPPKVTSAFVFATGEGDEIRFLQGGASSNGLTDTKMRVSVAVFFPRETVDDSTAQKVVADIERAVLTDRNRGGEAINTTPAARSIFTARETEPMFGIGIQFVVHYRHEFADPTQRR